MESIILPIAALLPIAGGVMIYHIKEGEKRRNRLCASIVAASSLLTVWAILHRPEPITLIRLSESLAIALRLDGLGSFFAGMLSLLWPLATLYGFGYMKGEERQNSFFAFYTAGFGASLLVAFSANLLTLYCFYELLTLSSVPLVMHPMNAEARKAARLYLYMSIAGSAFAFLGIVYLLGHGAGAAFAIGGILDAAKASPTLLLAVLVVFLGFGVKAAIFPLHIWLPRAAVAPTPVTALLHAVAIVKAGVFAVMRLYYCCCGADILRGSFVQYIGGAISIFTIVFGSVMALKEVHLKRRLAYSTVANLSYILFSVHLLSDAGLSAALTHMLCHAIIKICAFFAAGVIVRQSGREYIFEQNGMAKKMPITFACFGISALALSGIPPFCGFISKWSIAMAAAADGGAMAVGGIIALIISAALTAGYMFSAAVRGYFLPIDPEAGNIAEGNSAMLVPMVLCAVLCLALGLNAKALLSLTELISIGTI